MASKAWIKAREKELTAPSLAAFEQRIANDNLTFDKFLDEIYGGVSRDRNRYGIDITLEPPAQTVAKLYATLEKLRDKRDKAKAKYEKLKKAYDDFKKGKTALDASSETERRDYTLWLDTANGNVEAYVLHHDEAANPLSLGYFELSADGRSVSAVGDLRRLDITRQVPHHSKPDVNAFEVDSTKTDRGQGARSRGDAERALVRARREVLSRALVPPPDHLRPSAAVRDREGQRARHRACLSPSTSGSARCGTSPSRSVS